MKAIIDLVLLGILIVCTWTGYKKGILMGIGGILVIIVGIYGGNLLANLFSYDVVPAMKPFVSGFVEGQLQGDSKLLEQMGWNGRDYSVEDLLQQHPERREEFAAACYVSIGIDAQTAEHMAERVVTYAGENDVAVKDATVHILCVTASYLLCFVLGFLLIVILLTVIGNLPNLSFKIPHLDLVNDIGGAVLGLFTGLLFCVVLVWALKFMGKLLGNGTLSDATFGGWLLRKDFLFKYLNI